MTDGRELLLYAEDIGRHNTIDRLAGEALLRGVNLTGMALITSGRVSSEMAAKAALLGVPLIASRTSPTDMAVTICSQAGITLVGYVRGGRFTVYSHAELITMGNDSHQRNCSADREYAGTKTGDSKREKVPARDAGWANIR